MREAAAEAAREGARADRAGKLAARAAAVDESLRRARRAVPDAHAESGKGSEFDRVVLVEPEAIAREGERIEGLRALYVALTRATKTLVVVHALPLPPELRLAA